MSSFPDRLFTDAGVYAQAYFARLREAAATVDPDSVAEAARILARIYAGDGTVYSCGNGGSAAIANHLVCDHCKLVRTDTKLTPRVVSLSSNVEMITAIGNDISYDEIFAYQLRCHARPGDALI
ncbi:MAG: phosphoheptose isomerase, partial [Burkholderiales bacterium]|nr:phosphoheptose isomerase [Burkholderiales bacterium]